jgi:hypothetical protein
MFEDEDEDDHGHFVLLPRDAHVEQCNELWELRQKNAELTKHVERLTAIVDELVWYRQWTRRRTA